MEQDTLRIVYSPDDRYAGQTLVSMASALENSKGRSVEFIILHAGLSQKNKDDFARLCARQRCALRWVEVDRAEFADLPLSHWVPVEAWFRVKIAEACPDIDKALYLDGDTLVDGDLGPLWDTDLGEHYFAGVPDVWGVAKNTRRLDIKDGLYFNSGMLLINARVWREKDMLGQIRAFAKAYARKIEYCDQDSLNKIADGAKLALPPIYNYMETWWRNHYCEYQGECMAQYRAAAQKPTIIHFTGPKPGQKGCAHALAERWWHYARQTDIISQLQADYANSTAPIPAKPTLAEHIFSVKNTFEPTRKVKVLTVCGLKFKFPVAP